MKRPMYVEVRHVKVKQDEDNAFGWYIRNHLTETKDGFKFNPNFYEVGEQINTDLYPIVKTPIINTESLFPLHLN